MTSSAVPALSYDLVGMSRPGAAPVRGFRVGDQRALLGRGDDVWARAVHSVSGWAVKKGVGFSISPDDETVVDGRDYVTRAGFGLAHVNEPVRVVWVTEEPDRRGFGYGTCPGHPLRGEECFLVERDPDGSVWFRTRTVSRVAGSWWPLWLGIRLIQPIMQRRYARSAAALVEAADALPGFRAVRRGLVGEGPDRVDGIARLGYGFGGPAGPFDAPPSEDVELDPDGLPWELRDEDGDSTPASRGD